MSENVVRTSEQNLDPEMVHVVTIGAASIYVAKGHLLLIHMHGTSMAKTPAQWIESAHRGDGGPLGG